MYTVWNVTFRIKPDNRGACDPLLRTEPPARGSVGDTDPFSDAFGRVLGHVEDSVDARSTRYEQASSAASDTSDFFSLQSPIQDSPLTPNTEQSISSRFELSGSISRQSYHQPLSPQLDYFMRNVDSSTSPRTLTYDTGIAPNATSNLRPPGEFQSESNHPNSEGAPTGAPVISEPINHLQTLPAPTIKRKRKKKAPFSTTRRPPVKSREQHLSDNKAAASKCRQQRKAWEAHLQDTSHILQASINASKSSINQLGDELATLKRQLWECADCTDCYVYSRGLESNKIPSGRGGTDTVITQSDDFMT